MAYVNGECRINELYNILIETLTAAGWVNVSSDPTVSVLNSKGESGIDEIFLVVGPGDTKTEVGRKLSISACENYEPGEVGTSGTFINNWAGKSITDVDCQHVLFRAISPASSDAGAIATSSVIKYWIVYNKDYFILVTYINPMYINGYNNGTSVAFAGMIDRINPTIDKKAIMVSLRHLVSSSTRGKAFMLENLNKGIGMTADYVPVPVVQSVFTDALCKMPWAGDTFAFGRIALTKVGEGLRGYVPKIFANTIYPAPSTSVNFIPMLNNLDIVKNNDKSYLFVYNNHMSTSVGTDEYGVFHNEVFIELS